MSNGENAAENRTLYGFPVRVADKRKSSNPNGRAFDIQQLWDRQQEILNLNALGYKGVDIARILNVHPVTVSNTLNSTLGKEVKENLRNERNDEYEELREDVLELTKKSLKVYHEILDAADESRKLKKETADTITLELAGMRAPTRIDTRSVSMTLSKDEIEGFKERGIKAAVAAGKIVVVENEDN